MSNKPVKRKSKQRELVLKLIKGTDVHPDADWVYERARRVMPRVSLGTVYRNLHSLSEEGQIVQMVACEKVVRFDGNVENHYHFFCERCGRIVDLGPAHDEIARHFRDIPGLVVRDHRVEVFGLCSTCAGQKRLPRGLKQKIGLRK